VVDEIKNLADQSEENYEELFSEHEKLILLYKDATRLIKELESANAVLTQEKHKLEGEIQQLQNMLEKLSMHVVSFMNKYTEVHEKESRKVHPTNLTSTTHNHGQQEQTKMKARDIQTQRRVKDNDTQRLYGEDRTLYAPHNSSHDRLSLNNDQKDWDSDDDRKEYNL